MHTQRCPVAKARKERGLVATRKAKEEPNFNDFENYNLEVSTYNTQIKELKLRIAELTKAKADLDKLRAEQELFEEIAKSDQIHEIQSRLLELPNEDRHRLLTGMLDGDIVVKPPSPGAKLDKDTHFGLKDWVKFAFKHNVSILNDILGIEYTSSDGNHQGWVGLDVDRDARRIWPSRLP